MIATPLTPADPEFEIRIEVPPTTKSLPTQRPETAAF